MVTVTNEVPKAPNVFMMSPCESSPGSLLVGCLATGFSPAESVHFKWMDERGNSLTNFIQYPTVRIRDKMMKVSHITINEAKWNQNKITCEAGHPSRNVKADFTTVNSQKPTLSLVLVTSPKSTYVMCVIEDFYPKKIDVQWKVNNTNSMTKLKLERNLNEDTGHYTAYSFYEVSRKNWDANTLYTCEVTHRGEQIIMEKYFNDKVTLILKPPNEKALFVHNKVILQAIVSGDVEKMVQDASVSCEVKNVPVTNENITPGNMSFSNNISQFIKLHNVIIDTKKWFDGEIVTCTIHDTNNNRDIKQEIHFDKGDGQKPSVFIYKPDLINKDRVALVCEVTSSKLGDVYIMWKVGDEPYIEGTTSAAIHQNNYTSVLSFLSMSKEKYEKNTITCEVKHANMDHTGSPLQASTSQITLTLKPPNEKELFVHNKVILQAIVSGDVEKMVQDASVSCEVKNVAVTNENITPGNMSFSNNISQFIKLHNVIIDTKKWFDGEIVTCTIHDTNNNRDIKQEIHFDKGDGQKPSVFIYKPDLINKDRVAVVCEVTSSKLGDVYIMWKVGDEPYIEGTTSAAIHQNNYTSVLSFLSMSKEKYEKNTITCEVKHANMDHTGSPLQASTSQTTFTLTLKSPIERELFLSNTVVLEAVVSGDAQKTVTEASVSCKVKAVPVISKNIKPGNIFSTNTSQFIKIHNVTIDTKKWFDGEIVTCTIRDTNNNRDIKQEIRFDKGDGKNPNVTIYKPDSIDTDHVSHVCEVTSPKLGDVYIMWKVDEEPYKEGRTSARIYQENSFSVLSILTMAKQKYEDPKTTITCAVKHANMKNPESPLQVSTSQREPPEPENGFALDCNKDVLEEDEFRSLWSTATSFIFLFLFSLTYSAVLSFFKVKQ